MKTRIFTMTLAFVMCLGMSLPAWAATNGYSEYQVVALTEMLLGSIGDKDFGLEEASVIEDIQIGKPINVYLYTDNGFTESAMMSPVLCSNKLAVIGTYSLTYGKFSLSTALVEPIRNALTNYTKSFALVFDYDSCYLFDGENWQLLRKYRTPNENLAVLNSKAIMDTSAIELNNSLAKTFNLTNDYAVRAENNLARSIKYQCNVSIVRQTTDDTCWAACAAMVANYKTGSSYTDIEVAKKYTENYVLESYDNWDFAFMKKTLALLGVTNYKNIHSFSGDVIATNLANDYPVVGDFKIISNRYHSCVIYGIEGLLSIFYMIDPEEGRVKGFINESTGDYYFAYGAQECNLTTICCPLN